MKNILAYLGILLEIFAAFLILPIIVAIIYGEPVVPFLIPTVISLFLGVVLDKNYARGRLNLNEGLSLTAMTFIIFSLIGSIPYLYIFVGTSDALVLDSFFEAISGFTILNNFATTVAIPLKCPGLDSPQRSFDNSATST